MTEHEAVDPQLSLLLAETANALGTSISEQRIRLYARLLGDLSLAEVKSALGAHLRESRWFPAPADIIQRARGHVDDAGLLAWAALSRAAEDVGGWSSLQVDDGAAAAALETVFGSWPEFCALEDGPALHARRAEFMAAYREHRRRGAEPKRLAGRCEAENPGGAVGWAGRLLANGTVAPVRADRQLGTGGDRR